MLVEMVVDVVMGQCLTKYNENMIPHYKTLRSGKLVKQILAGEVGVMPSDTLYGLMGSALLSAIVERIYKLRRRATKKPMIILISGLRDLEKFGVRLNKNQKKFLQQYWPGTVSVVLKCFGKKWTYLHRGGGTLAFRWPKYAGLEKLLKQTGPLVAPSANWAGEPQAETVRAAQKYFGGGVDFYVDVGKLAGKPSTLVRLDGGGRPMVLREGSVKMEEVKNEAFLLRHSRPSNPSSSGLTRGSRKEQ